MRRLFLTILALLVVGATLTTGAGTAAAADGVPLRVTGLSLVSSTATTATIRWTATADPTRRGFVVYITDSGLGYRGSMAVSTSANQATVPSLTPGRAYTLSVVAYNSAGLSPAATVWVTPTEPLCVGRVGCVGVDASAVLAPMRRAGNGYLHGLSSATDAARLAALEPTSWRVGNHHQMPQARSTGAEVTLVLSDVWYDATMSASYGGAIPPWMAWDYYAWFLETYVRGLVVGGLAPDYWDIHNEPDANGNNYYGPGIAPTRAELLEQYRVAHDAIRRALPTAKIVAPSLGVFTPVDDAARLDLRSFVEFAVAHDLKFDAISWHEIGNNQFGTFDADPRSILTHVATARAILADNPAFGAAKIFLNEYGAPWWQLMPGATVGYFAALEEAGVDGANMTCTWFQGRNACHDGSLGGLLQRDAKTPTDAYWTHAALAELTGSRVRSSATDPAVSVLAGRATNGGITVLVGRHWGCLPSVTEHCSGATALPAFFTNDLVVKLPTKPAKRYKVVVQRNVETTGPVTSLPVSFDKVLTPSAGRLVVPLSTIADGEAVTIRITPA